MISKLIQLYYKNQSASELAHMILRDTQDIYQEKRLLVGYPEERQLLKEFYSALLERNTSMGIDPIIIRGFIALNTVDEILMHKALLNQALESNKLVPIDVSLALKIALAFKSQELEELYIPKIICILQKENKADLDALFTGAIVGKLVKQGLNSLQAESKTQINDYLAGIEPKFDVKVTSKHSIRKSILNQNSVVPQAAGMWLEALALVNARSFKDASKYVAYYLSSANKKNYKKYILGLSNSSYMKQIFDSEPILIDFKKSNHEFYQNTVGMPARYSED